MAVVGAVAGVAAFQAGPSVEPAVANRSSEVALSGVTYGVGPFLDGAGTTIPWFLNGTTVPKGDQYERIYYPANFFSFAFPFSVQPPAGIATLVSQPYFPSTLDESTSIALNGLMDRLSTTPAGEPVHVVGMSQGAIPVDKARFELAKNADNADYQFMMIGNPLRPNGGFLARFPKGTVPFIGMTFGRDEPADSGFKTTDIATEYDFFSDFPKYGNPVSLLNTVAAGFFVHVLPGYFTANPNDPGRVEEKVGATTYSLLPSDVLPILFPAHAVASMVGMQRFVDFLDPILRVFVDMGYDRTQPLSEVSYFEPITPWDKVQEALKQIPEAFQHSIAILLGAEQAHSNLKAEVGATATGDTTDSTDNTDSGTSGNPDGSTQQAALSVGSGSNSNAASQDSDEGDGSGSGDQANSDDGTNSSDGTDTGDVQPDVPEVTTAQDGAADTNDGTDAGTNAGGDGDVGDAGAGDGTDSGVDGTDVGNDTSSVDNDTSSVDGDLDVDDPDTKGVDDTPTDGTDSSLGGIGTGGDLSGAPAGGAGNQSDGASTQNNVGGTGSTGGTTGGTTGSGSSSQGSGASGGQSGTGAGNDSHNDNAA